MLNSYIFLSDMTSILTFSFQICRAFLHFPFRDAEHSNIFLSAMPSILTFSFQRCRAFLHFPFRYAEHSYVSAEKPGQNSA
jgi:hypothetical protein